MAEIGKALVFYLKYFPQMERFYEDKKLLPKFKGHQDRELVAKKIKAVGEAAGTDVANLLEACFGETLERLSGLDVVRLSPGRRTTTERKWDLRVSVAPRRRKSSDTTHQIGVFFSRDGVTPWAWSRGGVAAEGGLRRMLGAQVESFGSSHHGWSGGAIALKTIPVPWESATPDFTLDADDVIKKTKKVCEAFSPAFIRKFVEPLR